MFAVIYRWRVAQGREEEFIRGWRLVSEAVKEEFGSLGSRLHVAEDGLYVSYGRWRAAEDRLPYRDHLDFHAEGWRLMQDAMIEELPEIRMRIIGDILDETADSLPALRGMA